MAKSFKQLPLSGTGIPARPLSEQDFFDLTAELPTLDSPAPTVKEPLLGYRDLAQPVEAAVGEATEGPDVTSPSQPLLDLPTPRVSKRLVRRPAGNTGLPEKTELPGKLTSRPVGNDSPSAQESPVSSAGVRQTFVVGATYLERLRDYVHDRRSRGDYLYSQRQALQEALELLFAGSQAVGPRPAYLREQEQQQRGRIKAGRQSGAGRREPPLA